ncbi:MAG: cytochrome c3 family protein [Bryobacteraceae bacterium]|nr:cytochrome c3 family protein [Bryobacteraceae bacterium]
MAVMGGKWLALVAIAAFAQVPEPKILRPPPPQPLPFSHRTHAGTGLKCVECHSMPAPGDFATLPATAKCMACHIAVKKESPHVAKLAEFHREGKPVPWERVYRVPDYVVFSHKIHMDVDGVSCQTCHGPVEQRDRLQVEKDISMAGCMDCHSAKQASNDCQLCHDQR